MTIKQRAWREAKREVRQITDRLGMPVDMQIIDTVTALRVLGFSTIGSCGGHVHRVTSGPYVMLESPKAHEYAELARKTSDVRSKEYLDLRAQANHFRALELQLLVEHLENFYLDRRLVYRRHLIVQSMPMTLNILKCQGAELAAVSSYRGRSKMLEESRGEMAALTEYLRNQYNIAK